jgi:hypothetical protein
LIRTRSGSSGDDGRGGRWEDDENSVHHWVIYKPTTTANRASGFIGKLAGMTTALVAGSEDSSVNPEGKYSTSSSSAYKEVPLLRSKDLNALGSDHVFFVVNHERTFKGVALRVTPWRLFADAGEVMVARGLPARIARPGVLLMAFDLEGAFERQLEQARCRVQARGAGQ